MSRTRTALGILGCAAAVAMVPSAALAAPGDTQFTCGGGVPDGWVVISYGAAGCRTIEQVAGFQVGTTLPVCEGSPVPQGWAVVYQGFTMSGCNLNVGFTGYGKQITRQS